jgi:hypothetical protein
MCNENPKIKRMSVEEALGTLIAAANPYIKRSEAAHEAVMHFIGPRDDGKGSLTAQDVTLSDIHVEEDSKYPAEWMFKGQPQKVHKALRIEYRYPKRGNNGDSYMVTDYLLIGYEGSGGAG